MTSGLSDFAARLRDLIQSGSQPGDSSSEARLQDEAGFNSLALELFALQFADNTAYQRICRARSVTPETVARWVEIPAAPAIAFKDFELTCLPPAQRTRVFCSSGTTGQRPSRHFHNAESLAVYDTSLLSWFHAQVGMDGQPCILTPGASDAPHSSLVYMFDVIRRDCGMPDSAFTGYLMKDETWALDFEAILRQLQTASHRATRLVLLGTAFSFVHLLDYLAERNLQFKLPPGSRLMETGGYKGRSRALLRTELHSLITRRLGISPTHIVSEYGMSELSSQAYERVAEAAAAVRPSTFDSRLFSFPPWARVQVISPETGRGVNEGGTGLLRIVDLANVFSVMAIQTEDLAIRRGDGFELIGRATAAEPRGCSLMSQESSIVNCKSPSV